MTSGQLPDQVPLPHVRGEQRRRVALLLETADVLAERARRTDDLVQAQVLLRRSAQRRAQAARLAAGEGRPAGRGTDRA
ncbi:hypothetical protein ABC795_01110 [Blastococcus sp. HT6-30]|uniref:hypothetical protein n=1 Tax=Blastococcus sp. HT6-30 TaxID=3144843 RepID=UPI00321A5E85